MLSAIASAILLILAFPNFNLSYLAFIGFVPLFFTIENGSSKKAFFISFFCGFLFYLGALYWLSNVTRLGLLLLCLYLALYFGIFGIVVNRIRHYTWGLSGLSVLILPITWIFLEYIQSNLFTGFGWLLLGYSQYKNILLIQIADFTGVYGVSFVVMVVNVTTWILIRTVMLHRTARMMHSKKNKFYARRAILYAILILVFVYSYGFFRLGRDTQRRTIKVSVIQGNIPQEMKWESDKADFILSRYIHLTRQAAFDEPDLIIWPETSFPGFFEIDDEKTERVLGLAKRIKVPLLLGANTAEGLKNFNSVLLISRQGKIINRYDKIHLVPFGEYVPFSNKFPALHSLILGELGEFTAGDEYTIFSISQSISHASLRFAALICYEDIFPQITRRFVQNGAQFLIVVTNDAWYGKSGAPYQHTACSVFRAVENRIPVIRCANTGYSCFIDKKGRIYDWVEKDSSHLFVTAFKTSTVSL